MRLDTRRLRLLWLSVLVVGVLVFLVGCVVSPLGGLLVMVGFAVVLCVALVGLLVWEGREQRRLKAKAAAWRPPEDDPYA